MALSDITQITPKFVGASYRRSPAKGTGSLPQPSDGLILDLQGADECPLMAISGHTAGSSRTSALPPKADIRRRDPASAATITCRNTFRCKKSSPTRVAIIGLVNPRKISLSGP